MATNLDSRKPWARSFEQPDDVIEMEGFVGKIVSVGGIAVGYNIHQPGWRWSEHVKPIVKTEWCQVHHVGVCLSGTVRIRASTGEEVEVKGGDVFDIPPGHDGWVVGNEPWVSIDWTGVRSFIPSRDVLGERVVTNLLFTDVVGSTERATQMGEVAWGELVAVHEDRMRDTLSLFRGREVKQTGDGILAVFDSAARAVRCALALIDVARGLGLEIRAGVHTGEVEMGEADLRGVAVHEAARIMSLAGSSEVWISATTYALIDNPGLNYDDLGEHQLKGLPGAKRLYRVVA